MKSLLVLLLTAASLLGADAAAFAARKAHLRELLQQQEFAKAVTEAQALNKEWPDDIFTYQVLVTAHLALGNYPDADRALQWMLDLRLGKADLNGYWLLARFREVTGDPDGAIEAMNAAFVRLQTGETGNRAQMLAYLADLHLLAGKTVQAGRILRDAGEAEEEVLDVRARWLVAQSKRAEAREIWRQLATKTATPRWLYRLAVESPEDGSRFEQAARKIQGDAVNANRELVLYLAGPGQKAAEALTLARQESARRHDVLTQDALAVALSANGQRDEAIRVMKEVLAVGTVHPEILAHAALLGLKPE